MKKKILQVNLKTTRRKYEGSSYQSSKPFPTKHVYGPYAPLSYQLTGCHNTITCKFCLPYQILQKVQLMTILTARARSAEERPPSELCKRLGVFNAKFVTNGAHTTTVVVRTINSATITTRLTTQQLAQVISSKHQRRNVLTHTYLPKTFAHKHPKAALIVEMITGQRKRVATPKGRNMKVRRTEVKDKVEMSNS